MNEVKGDRIAMLLLGACGLLLAWKAWMVWRLNINWDEFYFLTHVHALLRGDLAIFFQTSFAQLFRWLPWVGATELPQIYAGRLVMLALLALSALQIARLATRWVSPGAAMVAVVAFLCALPTQRHGASFRVDSMLLPVLLGSILLLTRTQHSRRADIGAGLLCGVGIALSVKIVLFAPLLFACVLLAKNGSVTLAHRRAVVVRGLIIGAATLATASVLISLHKLSLHVPPVESTATFASRSAGKTVFETSFIPMASHLRNLVSQDWLIWSLILLGTLLALYRRRWQMAALALALLPILFYRNAFPYFYVVMLAPAVVVIAQVVEEIRSLARRGSARSLDAWLPTACGALLLLHSGVRLPLLSYDEQKGQRAVLDAVHEIFPQPVPYIDHSGMVATFPKVNFFMSTWGMDEYRRRGTPFVAPALRAHRPPMLLVTRDFLNAQSPDSVALLPEDRVLIQRFYQPYWGPVLVAGSRAELRSGESMELAMPFPGSYRLVSGEPVVIDGTARSQGDVVSVEGASMLISRPGGGADPGLLVVQLLWAGARPPPAELPTAYHIFMPL